jgi:hypothetical protein
MVKNKKASQKTFKSSLTLTTAVKASKVKLTANLQKNKNSSKDLSSKGKTQFKKQLEALQERQFQKYQAKSKPAPQITICPATFTLQSTQQAFFKATDALFQDEIPIDQNIIASQGAVSKEPSHIGANRFTVLDDENEEMNFQIQLAEPTFVLPTKIDIDDDDI